MMSKNKNLRFTALTAFAVALSLSVTSLMVGVVVAPAPAYAQRDQDDALKASRSKKGILPYSQISRRAEKKFGGRVVGQRVRQVSRDSWVYELRLLRDDGQVISVVMDAHTGEVLGSRGK